MNIKQTMRFRFPVFVFIMILAFGGCKDEDTPQTTSFTECCTNLYVNTTGDFTLYLPNAYTPNGDGLNDEFKFYTDSTLGVLAVSDLSIISVASGDTIISFSEFWDQRKSINRSWDFNTKNGIAIGELRLAFTIEDTSQNTHNIQTTISSLKCGAGKRYRDSDIEQCRFADQIDPRSGFVQPTSEPKCN